MAMITVDSLGDVTAADGVTTLREAIASASDGDTIVFHSSLSGGTVTLTQGEIYLNSSLEISIEGDLNGDQAADITIDANGGARIFTIPSGSTLNLSSLDLTGNNGGSAIQVNSGATLIIDHSTIFGNTASSGGAILNHGSVDISNCALLGNSSEFGGGAIANGPLGTLTVENTTISGNASLTDDGGAIENRGTMSLTNVTVTGNSADGFGGGLWNAGTATLTNTIVLGNTATTASEVAGAFTDGGGNVVTGSVADVFASINGSTGGGLVADNGGPVQTAALANDPANPALDVGSGSLEDARGETRVDIGLVGNDGSDFADAGAYELVCFATGTRIALADTEVEVEDLKIGDSVLCTGGFETKVKWIGRQTVMTRFGPAERLRLVRFAAGSLGNGLPHSDLTVTADHGMLVDGVICHAGALVNGTTITRVPLAEMGESYTVYHIETEAHEVILANGAPAETFIDNVSRRVFDNFAEFEALYGDVPEMDELPYPRAMSARQVPKGIFTRLSQRDVA